MILLLVPVLLLLDSHHLLLLLLHVLLVLLIIVLGVAIWTGLALATHRVGSIKSDRSLAADGIRSKLTRVSATLVVVMWLNLTW